MRRAAARTGKVVAGLAIASAVAAGVLARLRRGSARLGQRPGLTRPGLTRPGLTRPGLRLSRGLATVQLALRGGLRYAGSAPRLFAAAGRSRQQLRNDLALQTAEDIAATLGAMKGVLMKIGQMASYVDDGLSPAVRRTLSRLQDSVPPMSPELAATVLREELGVAPERAFARWDPEPIAAASIGQVHRAITHDGRAVAVKVQYPGIAETIAADLDNVALLRRMLRITAPNQDVEALVAELRERVLEELDYRREAENQRYMAAYYDGHPTIRVPKIIDELSTRRVVTSELAAGARFSELATWSQRERDLAAETIYRFVFRSLYEIRAFNGDPHPGNYLFHGDGKVTFLDFGLVKHFTEPELQPLVHMVRDLCVNNDPEAFRHSMEEAGFLVTERAAQHRHDRRPHGGVLRHRPAARAAHDHRGLRVLGRPPVLRPAQPGGRVREHPAFLRDPAAHQPGGVRPARAAERDRRLAADRGGDLAFHAPPGLYPDGAR